MSDSRSDRVTYADVAAAGLDDWRMLQSGIHARFETGSFAAGVRLVDAIGAAADEVNHHPDVTLTYPRVDVALVSHDVGRVTDRDLALARRISEIAREQGVASDPAGLQQLELGLDSPDESAVLPFWRDLLAFGGSVEEGGISDPHGRLPSGLVPGVGQRGAAAALAPRRLGAGGPGAGAHRRGGRRRRPAGRRVPRPLVLGARGRRGQPVVRVHDGGPLRAARAATSRDRRTR